MDSILLLLIRFTRDQSLITCNRTAKFILLSSVVNFSFRLHSYIVTKITREQVYNACQSALDPGPANLYSVLINADAGQSWHDILLSKLNPPPKSSNFGLLGLLIEI